MPKLFIRFGFYLTDYDPDIQRDPEGPLFHRWLPNGEEDALIVDVPNESASIKFWFERRGYIEGKKIIYDSQRKEVQDDLIPLQTILNAGALRGQIELKNVSKTALNAVIGSKIGNKSYEALGKKVINKLLVPEANRFINILKYRYGQYWLSWDLNTWDSRVMSLGRYCNENNLEWSADGDEWTDFIPNQQKTAPITLHDRGIDYSHFLAEGDWNEIGELLSTRFEHPFGAEVLYRAHRLRSESRMKYALIEAVTALEIILDWYYRSHLSNPLNDWDNGFLGQSIPSKITVTTALTGKVNPSDAKLALKAYKRRNEIVHDGKDVGEDASDLVKGILRYCSPLVQAGPGRFPWADAWNEVFPEGWEDPHKDAVIVVYDGEPL
jgi:hypothetical protein